MVDWLFSILDFFIGTTNVRDVEYLKLCVVEDGFVSL